MNFIDVLTEINELSGVTATKISVWDPERERYITYVMDGNAKYGEDFDINETQGIFVYLKEGVGYWTPKP